MWNNAYLESRVLSADPLELVGILYEHALLSVEDARRGLNAGDIAGRSKAISRAIAIISELDCCLDHASGGSISRNLADLYHYMRVRLTAANAEQRDEPLAEVHALLSTLFEAWTAIQPAASAAAPAPEPWTMAPAAQPDLQYAAHAWSA